jgi:hypothetical protein
MHYHRIVVQKVPFAAPNVQLLYPLLEKLFQISLCSKPNLISGLLRPVITKFVSQFFEELIVVISSPLLGLYGLAFIPTFWV